MSGNKRLLSTWHGSITAVVRWRVGAEERALALRPSLCAQILRDLAHGGRRHDLVQLYELASGVDLNSPSHVENGTLIAALETAIEKGTLLFIRTSAVGGAGRARPEVSRARDSEQDRLVKEVMGARETMEFEGRRYRFAVIEGSVAGGRGGFGGDDYQPVPSGEAGRVVARMADKMAKTADEHATWARLAKELTRRGNGPAIVLRRYVPWGGVAANTPDGPVTTPSHLRPSVAVTDWVEIEVHYEDGTPFDGNVVVELPDGRVTNGAPGDDGVIRIAGITPGSCKTSFPDLDAAAWSTQ